MTKKEGLFLTKEELKKYGLLKKDKRKRKVSRRKKKFQDDRTPKNPNSQGIRSTSDHMQAFGGQINRSNDLAIELGRQAFEKEEKAKKERELAKDATSQSQALVVRNTSAPNFRDEEAHNSLDHIVSYLHSERQKIDKRLKAIEAPAFRINTQDSDGVGTTSFSSNKFRAHGDAFPKHFDPKIDQTFQHEDEPETIDLDNPPQSVSEMVFEEQKPESSDSEAPLPIVRKETVDKIFTSPKLYATPVSKLKEGSKEGSKRRIKGGIKGGINRINEKSIWYTQVIKPFQKTKNERVFN